VHSGPAPRNFLRSRLANPVERLKVGHLFPGVSQSKTNYIFSEMMDGPRTGLVSEVHCQVLLGCLMFSVDLTAVTLHVPGHHWQTGHSLGRLFAAQKILWRQEGSSVLAAPLTMLPLIYNMKSRMPHNPLLPNRFQVCKLDVPFQPANETWVTAVV